MLRAGRLAIDEGKRVAHGNEPPQRHFIASTETDPDLLAHLEAALAQLEAACERFVRLPLERYRWTGNQHGRKHLDVNRKAAALVSRSARRTRAIVAPGTRRPV